MAWMKNVNYVFLNTNCNKIRNKLSNYISMEQLPRMKVIGNICRQISLKIFRFSKLGRLLVLLVSWSKAINGSRIKVPILINKKLTRLKSLQIYILINLIIKRPPLIFRNNNQELNSNNFQRIISRICLNLIKWRIHPLVVAINLKTMFPTIIPIFLTAHRIFKQSKMKIIKVWSRLAWKIILWMKAWLDSQSQKIEFVNMNQCYRKQLQPLLVYFFRCSWVFHQLWRTRLLDLCLHFRIKWW